MLHLNQSPYPNGDSSDSTPNRVENCRIFQHILEEYAYRQTRCSAKNTPYLELCIFCMQIITGMHWINHSQYPRLPVTLFRMCFHSQSIVG